MGASLKFLKILYNDTMRKNLIIFLLSLWIILIPFLGFPGSWRTFFIVISGLVIAVLVFLDVARKRMAHAPHSSGEDNETKS